MTTTDPDILSDDLSDPASEAALLQAVRDGSTGAFGILYARYRPFAVTVAYRALSRNDGALAEDVAEVAFIRVLTALRNGKGPTDTLRAYLATTVRREVWRAERRLRRQAEVTDRWASDDERSGEPALDALHAEVRDLNAHALLGEAFRGLSDRWRSVLWLTEVEGRRPAEVAPMLGVSAGTASALAYRARNGLITAYLAAYRRSSSDEACVAIAPRLGKYLAAREPLQGYDDVRAHLDGCASCRDVLRGVDVLGATLASFAPFGLLTAGLWAKGVGGGSAGAAGVAGVAGRTARGAGPGSTGGAGVVAAAVAAGLVVAAGAAAWVGALRSTSDAAASRASSRPSATAPAAGPGARPAATAGTSPTAVAPAGPGTPATTAPSTSTSTSTSTTTPTTSTSIAGPHAPPARPPAMTVSSRPSVATTAAPTTTTSSPPASTSTSTTASTTTSTSTSTTSPNPGGPVQGPAQLSGRATSGAAPSGAGSVPVADVAVVASDVLGPPGGHHPHRGRRQVAARRAGARPLPRGGRRPRGLPAGRGHRPLAGWPHVDRGARDRRRGQRPHRPRRPAPRAALSAAASAQRMTQASSGSASRSTSGTSFPSRRSASVTCSRTARRLARTAIQARCSTARSSG